MNDSSPKQEPPYGLRMPPDLKARVKAAAEANNRSMNAEIVAILEEKYPPPTLLDMSVHDMFQYLLTSRTRAEKAARLDEVNRQIAKLHPHLGGRFEEKRPGHVRLHLGNTPEAGQKPSDD